MLTHHLPGANFHSLRLWSSTIRHFDTWLLHLHSIVDNAWILTSVSMLRHFDNGHSLLWMSVRRVWILLSAQQGACARRIPAHPSRCWRRGVFSEEKCFISVEESGAILHG